SRGTARTASGRTACRRGSAAGRASPGSARTPAPARTPAGGSWRGSTGRACRAPRRPARPPSASAPRRSRPWRPAPASRPGSACAARAARPSRIPPRPPCPSLGRGRRWYVFSLLPLGSFAVSVRNKNTKHIAGGYPGRPGCLLVKHVLILIMDFTPDESQQAVAGLAAEVLTAADPWIQLAKAGLLSLGVMDTAVLLTEIGRRAPGIAMKALATLMTGALPLARWGSSDLQQTFLPAVASGEMVLTAAIREAPLADEAALMVIPVSDGVALAEPADATLAPIPTSSGYPSFLVRLNQPPARMLGGLDCLADLEHLAVAGACALIDGAVAGALALTRDHVATRRQFGRPLAEFQAVSQQIADVYIASRT